MQAVLAAQKTVPFRVLKAFDESHAGNYASALAFSGFLAMFPMILGALSIIGLIIRNPGAAADFQTLIVQMFPASAQSELRSAIQGVKQSAGWMGLVSIGGLIWSASALFATMEFALTQIFVTKKRHMLRQKLMGFAMMLLLVAAIVVTVGVNSVSGFLPYAWIASLLVGAIVMIGLLVVLYRFVPNRAFTLQQVLPGAVLAGLLIEVLSLAFPLYARYAGRFNTYGAQFGLFFLLATWFYLLSELMLLGAVYNRFRMGEPLKEGLIARPRGDSLDNRKEVEAIPQDKKGSAPEQSSVR
ncbi:MAG TPA: YihY/virulence factor BrkB family protein [Candidatus Baltobacterales bacterium]|nr:YihY/virulence factor BrkB family protein [Candidatus Baltobacterales bacterium]